MSRFLSVRLVLLAGLPAVVFVAAVLLGTQLASQHERSATAAAHAAFKDLVDGNARQLRATLDAFARDTRHAAEALHASLPVLDDDDLSRAPAVQTLLRHQPALAVVSIVGPDQRTHYASLRPFDRPDPLRRTIGVAFPPTDPGLRPHWSFRRHATDDVQLVRHETVLDAAGEPAIRLTAALSARDLDGLLRRGHPGPASTWLLLDPDGRLAALTKDAGHDDSPLVAGLLIRDPWVQSLVDRRDHPVPADGVRDLRVGDEFYLGRLVPLDLGDLILTLGSVVPRATFAGPLDADTRADLLRALAIAALATLLAFGISRSITGPLDDAAAEIEHVAALHPDPPRKEAIYREFATIQTAVDHLRRTQRSFMSFVPREVVRAIGASGRAARLEGETRELTILFTDAQGFTQWAQDRRPEELVVELGRYLTQICDEVTRHDGTVDKFLGDGVVAFWGAPHKQPQHAFMAVSAALASRKRLAERAARSDSTAFPTRFGLATGPVLVGNIGTPDRLNYTILGDTANYAARLEALNKKYQSGILVSETTAEAVLDRVIVRPVDIVTVQGRSRAERVYQPLALTSDPDAERFDQIAHLATEALQHYLQRRFDQAASLYAQLLRLDPRDGPAKVLLERCQRYDLDGVPHGWDGVEHTTK